jgi:hypothetical protein
VHTFPLYSPLNFVLVRWYERMQRATLFGSRCRDEAGLDPRLLVGRTQSWNPWLADCGEVLALRALLDDRRALRERDRMLLKPQCCAAYMMRPAPAARTAGRRFLRAQRHDFKSGIGTCG